MIHETNEVIKDYKVHSASYQDTGYFGKIILDYLSETDSLSPFYGRHPSLDSFESQISEKSASYQNRAVLVEALQGQYKDSKLKSTGLSLLAEENTFTITTGHQVCLFTGPVYFIYKIVSAIKTCRILSKRYPKHNFVPVFWMATEDHDFEEANHFNLIDKKIEWESGQGGAVGRMSTDGLEALWKEIESFFGIGYGAAQLRDLFKKAYLNQDNIAKATRVLVHQLFDKYGVVVVDGDDPKLKALAIDAFEKEIFEQPTLKAIESTNSELLKAGYKTQVHPRPINLFFLGDQLRERIVKREDGRFEVLHSKHVFSETEIKELLRKSPEKFSPNVALRGLYQEIILPNLAYIGGGGELAYWFQLKEVFKAFSIPFPVLMLRNSAGILNPKAAKLRASLDLDVNDLFRDGLELENALITRASDESLNLESERERLELLFLDIEVRLRRLEPTLEKTVNSAYAKTEKLLKTLEKKMLRAERKKQEVITTKLHELRAYFFPNDGLQERQFNFSVFYAELGEDFIEILLDVFDPLLNEFSIIEFQDNNTPS